MKDEPETVEFTTKVPIVDVDGRPIRVGSVVKGIDDNRSGVVVRILRKGDIGIAGLDCVGDLHILERPGTTRHTNRYSNLKHVPWSEQTYWQRVMAWMLSYEVGQGISQKDVAISGIMALHAEPDKIEGGSTIWEEWPATIEEALVELAQIIDKDKCVERGVPPS